MASVVKRKKIVAPISPPYLRVRTSIELHRHKYPERDFLLAPWLRRRMLAMVHAPTGIGKSWFCWSIAIGIASGKGFANWLPKNPASVLIIDGEMQPDDLQDRQQLLIRQLGLDKEAKRHLKNNLKIIARQDQDIDTDFPDLCNENDQDELLGLIDSINPDLVILDNLSTLANLEDENAAHAYNAPFRILTKLKQSRSAILVHHDKKRTNENSKEAYRGSSKMAAIFEQMIHLSPVPTHKKPKGYGACFFTDFQKNRYLEDASIKCRIFALHPEKGWNVIEDNSQKLVELANAVKSCDFVTKTEIANHFGHTRSWATKNIRFAEIEGYLNEHDWTNCSKKAKEKRKIEKMTDQELKQYEKRQSV